MKKLFFLVAFALIFGLGFSISTNAQIINGGKKVVKKTNRGLHKGWSIGKRVGQKTWRKGKGVTIKSYGKGKRVTVKGVRKVKNKVD